MKKSKLLSWVHRWIYPRVRSWFQFLSRRPGGGPVTNRGSLEFRKLERRRVYAVDAFFVSGALSIEISGTTQNTANLLNEGAEFFVDENNDFIHDANEVRGLISEIESISVVSKDNDGFFYWGGNFSAAPLSNSSTSNSVSVMNVQEAYLQATFHAKNDVSIYAQDLVTFDEAFVVNGSMAIGVGVAGSVIDEADAQVRVHGDLIVNAGPQLTLADEVSNSWQIDGATSIFSTGPISLGSIGKWDSSLLSVTSSELTLQEFNHVELGTLSISGSALITTPDSLSDASGADISIGGDLVLSAKLISLADDSNDKLIVFGATNLSASTGDISIQQDGMVQLGDITATGASISIYEDESTSLDGITAIGNLLIESSGAITDNSNASIIATASGSFQGSSVLLADSSNSILSIGGPASFVATSGTILLDDSGTVSLADVSASGTNVSIYEDASITLVNVYATGNLMLRSSGMIGDSPGAIIVASGNALLTGTSISLANSANDVVSIGGFANFIASTGSIVIANSGTVSLADISASGTNITIYEDASTTLRSIHATGNLFIQSSGMVGDNLNASIIAAGNGAFHGASISFSEAASDVLNIGGSVSLVATSGSITIGSLGTVSLGDVSASGSGITVYEDMPTSLADINSYGNGNLLIHSAGEITDVSSGSIIASGTSAFTGASITLADNSSDLLDLIGPVGFNSMSGVVSVNAAGVVTLGDVSASGTNITVYEDASTSLVNIAATGILLIQSSGSVTDVPNATIIATGEGFFSGTSIELADNAADALTIGGAVGFTATSGVVSINSAGLVTLGDVSASGTNVALFEDASSSLVNISATGNLLVQSSGAITDNPGASVIATGTGSFTGTSITLADNATDVLNIGGAVGFIATSGFISINSAGLVTLGDVSASGTNITLFEDASSSLVNISATGNLLVQSSGAITDNPGASIAANGTGSFTGTSITLADNATDVLNIGGAVGFTATSGFVSINSAGLVTLGDVSASGTNVALFEDASTSLTSISATGNLIVQSSGAITDNPGASIVATGTGSFTGTSITLADNAADVLNIGGAVGFIATSGVISINSAGLVTLGDVSASGTNVSLFEDASTTLTSILATGNLIVQSSGAITDNPGASIAANGTGSFTGTSITLADNATDVLNIGGAVEFTATSGFVSINSAGLVTLGDVSASGTNITLFEDASTTLTSILATGNLIVQSSGAITDNPGASIVATGTGSFTGTSITLADNAADVLNIGGAVEFTATSGFVSINSAGLVTLGDVSASGTNITLFEDASTTLTSILATGNLLVQSSGAITDNPGASVIATGTGSFTGTSITLADNAADVLNIVGAVGFIATSGVISINSSGLVTLGDVSASGTNVALFEDASTSLTSISATGNLIVQSSGAITDNPGASVIAAGTGSFTGTSITLADNTADVLNIGGAVGFTATSGFVSINSAGLVTLGDVSASGTNVALFEDASTSLTSISATGNLIVQSSGAITDNPGASVIAKGTGSFTGTSITLADNAADVLNIGGAVGFIATSGVISINAAGLVTLGDVSASGTNITLFEDASSSLVNISATGNLIVQSSGAITDNPGASVIATGTGSFTGTSITLADNAADVLNIGGAVGFTATSGVISINAAGLVTLGDVSASGTNVTLVEDASTSLTSISATGNLLVQSSGAITDNPGASVIAAGTGSFTGTSITLADNTADVLNIGGAVGFTATSGVISINAAGLVTLGDVSASGTNITLFEDASSSLVNISATGNLLVQSSGAITDNPGASIVATGTGSFTGTSITLADNATDVLNIGGAVGFTATSGLVSINSAGLVTLGDVSASGTNITLFEDASSSLVNISATGNLLVQSSGAITDNPGASVIATGTGSFTGTSITLADNAADVLNIGGAVGFTATSGFVSINSAGLVTLGDVSAIGTNVTLVEDASTSLTSISATGNLLVQSSGAITDNPGASVIATGTGSFTGTSITLADNTADVLNIGGAVGFTATSGFVSINSAGLVTLGDVSASGTNVALFEDASTSLTSISATGNLIVQSSGAITDNPGASVIAAGTGSFTGTSITLADNATDVLNIVGAVGFIATSGFISINSAGLVTLGDVSASGTNVTLFEDASTTLTSISATGNLTVQSSGAITDNPGASVIATGTGSFTGTSITLADNAADVLNIGGAVGFTATSGVISINSAGLVTLGDVSASGTNVSLFEDASTTLTSILATGNLIVQSSGAITDNPGASVNATGTGSFTGTSITLADNAADVLNIGGAVGFTATSGFISINSAGLVTLGDVSASGTNITLFEDASTSLTSISATGNLIVQSSGAITDNPGASIVATGTGSFTGTSITLADNAADVLNIGGAVGFIATSGFISINSAGLVTLGDVSASGTNITLFEDASTSLTSISATGNLIVQSSGAITDNPGASVIATGTGSFTGASITLADNAADVLNIGGAVGFTATSGVISINASGLVTLGDVSASGTNVTLVEDASTTLTSISATGNLTVQSSGAITDNPGGSVIAAGTGSFTGTSITLADNAADVLNIGGAVGFTATSGFISINSAGLVTLGDVSASGTNITLFEDASSSLVNISATGNLIVQSSGAITDNPGASVIATGTGSFTGTSITLADNAADVLNIGGAVGFTATSGFVSINSAGLVSLGDVSASGTNITLVEDASTSLTSISATGNLIIQSSGAITDNPGASIVATGTGSFTGTSITLADNATDVLNIGGAVEFTATSGFVSINSAGLVTLGDVSASGTNITLFDDASSSLVNISATGNLIVQSSGAITDNPGASIVATGTGSFTGTSITLADNATDVLNIGGAVGFTATSGFISINSAGLVTLGDVSASGTNITLFEDASSSLVNISATGNLLVQSSGAITDNPGASIAANGTGSFTGTSITLADNATDVLNIGGAVEFTATSGFVSINSAGLVTLGDVSASGTNITLFEDASTSLVSILATGNLIIQSSGAITDNPGASVITTGTGSFTGTSITLADNATDVLNIGGAVGFIATSGVISINSAGLVTLGDVSASGTNITLFEDASSSLVNISATGNLLVQSSGAITDNPGGSVIATGTGSFTGTSITLADNAADVLNIGGAVGFTATSGFISINSAGLVTLGDVSASGTNITLFDDASSSLVNISATGNLIVQSSGAITDNPGGSVIATGTGSFTGTSITLADNTADVLNIGGAVGFTATSGFVSINSAGLVTLGDVSASGTNVTLFEDTSSSLVNISATGNLIVQSSGAITDNPGASVIATGTGSFTGTSITLADNAADVLNIGGAVGFIATSGVISINSAGLVTLGDVSASGTNITLFEDASSSLVNISATGNLIIQSSGAITDNPGASVIATGTGSFTGASITLADNAADVLNISGAVGFTATSGFISINSAGLVTLGDVSASGTNITLFEDASTSLVSILATGNLLVQSSGAITDNPGASVIAAGTGSFTGASITLADNAMDVLNIVGAVEFTATSGSVMINASGLVLFGDVSASGTNISIFEDASMSLSKVEAVGSLQLDSSGAVTDILDARVEGSEIRVFAKTFISLADAPQDVLRSGGPAFFNATGDITIEGAGNVQFGSVGLVAMDVLLFEDDATILDGTFVRNLELFANSSITQTGLDTGAGTGFISVADNARFDLSASPGRIDLQRSPGLAWMENSIAGQASASGIQGDFLLRNNSSTASIGLISGTFDNFFVWHTNSSINLAGQLLDVSQDLSLVAGVDISDPNQVGTAHLSQLRNSQASIEDQGTAISVGGRAYVVAGGSVLLNDVAGESFVSNMELVSIVSLGGKDISIGGAGNTQIAVLGFNTSSIVNQSRGDVTVQIDGNSTLSNPVLPFPDGRTLAIHGSNAEILLNGNLNSLPGTQISISSNLSVVASGFIALNNTPDESLSVIGQSIFESIGASVQIGSLGLTQLGDVILRADQGDVILGGSGQTRLGLISAFANNIAIQEDAEVTIHAAFADGDLVLSSTSSILGTRAFSVGAMEGISANRAMISAATFAHLGTTHIDRISISVGQNGQLAGTSLFQLNGTANVTGQEYLQALGKNLPGGITPAGQTLSGESIEQLRLLASFEASFGRNYGFYIRNDKSLVVDSALNVGDGIHSYIETLAGYDITIAGSFIQRFTQQSSGGIVLIAGDQVDFSPSGRLIIESSIGDATTRRVISQPTLAASAFDGQLGPSGFQSTRDVLYASDANADSGTQNVLQRVSTQFGVVGESGFQTLVQYSDGNSQLFNTRQELYGSLVNGLIASPGTGVISAHSSQTGDAAVFQRSTPFSDAFLSTFQTLPTTAIFRRSEEFFIFANGGRTDNAVGKVDLTPVIDEVGEVYSPGRKVSFSLPSEIVVTPASVVPIPKVFVTTDVNYAQFNTDVESRVVSQVTFQVSIVQVGFDDIDNDGQVSEEELPTRNEIQIVALEKDREDDSASSDEKIKSTTILKKRLMLGEVDLASRDVKAASVATTQDIETWIEEYRNNPNKPAGSYAIIAVDSVNGIKILKVFSIRDFETVDDGKTDDEQYNSLDPTDGAIKPPEAKPSEGQQPDVSMIPRQQQPPIQIAFDQNALTQSMPYALESESQNGMPWKTYSDEDKLESMVDADTARPLQAILASGALSMIQGRRSAGELPLSELTKCENPSRFSRVARKLRFAQVEK